MFCMFPGFRAAESDKWWPWKASEGTEELPRQHTNPQQQTHLWHVRCNVKIVSSHRNPSVGEVRVLFFMGNPFLHICRTHCNSQVLSQKELCDEKLAAAKLDFEKKLSKLTSTQVRCFPLLYSIKEKVWKLDRFKIVICNAQWLFLCQDNSPGAATKEDALGTVKTVASTVTNHSEPQVNEAAEMLTNEITVGKGKDMRGLWSNSLPYNEPSEICSSNLEEASAP